ncbi:MAG: TIM-barrel domain-containing protein, partial [Planctomycetota bacterium]
VDIDRGTMQHVYGLGQQFRQLGSADGDWIRHRQRQAQPPGQSQSHGNGFMPFGSAGMVGNVQIPVMYAVGTQANYAIFLDNVYKQSWNFGTGRWEVRMWGDQVRYYVMAGPDLADLRKDYLELVGTPPVPPRKAFGLWVSEFGYKKWSEIDDLVSGLRSKNFPVDGFVLDLFWFGGVKKNSPDSLMGQLDWDRNAFANPEARIKAYGEDHLGLVAIEESYINLNTPTYHAMRAAGPFFAGRQAGPKDPVVLTDWFGQATMVDWSNPQAGEWIHRHRRFPNLVAVGVLGHWTDLGEPEKYKGTAFYQGVETTSAGVKNRHGDVHNLYNVLWNKSIYDGYYDKRQECNRRPFIVTRSGSAGTQRFGAAMWSGDIGANLELLATHSNAQLHMSLSGIDYYGADIGGFRREGMPGNAEHKNDRYEKELYTQWFANGAWFDLPVRPHTDNAFQEDREYHTSPHLVGDLKSNLANLRQRYKLIPYYYSLAHRAHLFAEPVVPPLVYHYQHDQTVREIGHEKMIGRDFVVGIVARHGEYKRNVYLPAGKWVNYHCDEWISSTGQWLEDVPVYRDGVFRLPVFVRAGAIVPQMFVDENTKDSFGHRSAGSADRQELIIRVYADPCASEFTLYEDDGVTIGYDSSRRPTYAARTTLITQQQSGNVVTVAVHPANGSFPGAISERGNLVKLVAENAKAKSVTLNGDALTSHASKAAFDASDSGWFNAGGNLILAKSPPTNVSKATAFVFNLEAADPTTSAYFVCHNAWTQPGEEIYLVGGIPELGSWKPEEAIRMDPSVCYQYITKSRGSTLPGPASPIWTKVVADLPPKTKIEWKCLRKRADGSWQWQEGPNSVHTTGDSGYSGVTMGHL